MEKHTMRDYVLQTPAVLRRLLTEHWEAPRAAAFAAGRSGHAEVLVHKTIHGNVSDGRRFP